VETATIDRSTWTVERADSLRQSMRLMAATGRWRAAAAAADELRFQVKNDGPPPAAETDREEVIRDCEAVIWLDGRFFGGTNPH
jgi:putative hemolysin